MYFMKLLTNFIGKLQVKSENFHQVNERWTNMFKTN